jgi:putative transposase
MDTKGHCFPKSIIIQAVYLKLRFTLSYRDVEEIMRIRGVEVDHATIQRWVYKFMPEIEIQMRKRKRVVGKRWRMDETYSVPGSLRYYIAETRVYLKYVFSYIYARLCGHLSLSGSDSSCIDEVMKPADKGK